MSHIIRNNDIVDSRQPSPLPLAYLPNSSSPLLHHHHDCTGRLPYDLKSTAATPSPTNQRIAPEMVSILATSSPEIETLMGSSSFDFLDRPNSHNSLKRQTSATTVLDDINFIPAMTVTTTTTLLSQAKTPAPVEKRHVPRVSLSPPRDAMFASASTSNSSSMTPAKSENLRFPLDDITRSLCRVRLSSPSTSSNGSQRFTPSRARGPSQMRKPSLHRRVSFDMLPSPAEIGSLPTPNKATRSASLSSIPSGCSPVKGRRHRRNTTVIVLSSSRK